MAEKMMTAKMKRFCDEYLVDLNATQAAIRAGYSKKTAEQAASRLLINVKVRKEIDARMQEKQSELIADQDEVLRYLTSVLRGQSESEVVVVEGAGDGFSEARRMVKAPDEKDRLKAAELLGKRYSLFTDKIKADVAIPVVIAGDELLED